MNLSALCFYTAPIVKELTSFSIQQRTKIFSRVKDILTKGFYLCGQQYSFLAFSSNQLRDQSTWFFAEDRELGVSCIHKWMCGKNGSLFFIYVCFSFMCHQHIIRSEPDFGTPISDPFFCFHHKEGILFDVMFLVNIAVHKGIFNQHQMTNRFFELLANQSKAVNMAALKHISSYKPPVFYAYKRLKLV